MDGIKNQDWFVLQAGNTEAAVLTPWTRLYRRTRFHRAAFVAELKVDGVCFTQKEQDQPHAASTGGMGLCCEYKCPELEKETEVGGLWLKPGVGILRRKEKEWTALDETTAEALPCLLEAGKDTAVFTTQTPLINETAYEEQRTLHLQPGKLTLEVRLRNIGIKTLHLLEYCHNFVSLGETPVGPGQRLLLPAVDNSKAIQAAGELIPTSTGIRWPQTPEKAFFRPKLPARKAEPAWRLEMENGTRAVEESVSFSPCWVSLWGTNYCVCAEVYQSLTLRQGEEASWRRTWKFEV